MVLPLKSQEEATQQRAPRDYTAKLLYGCGIHKYNAQQIRILIIVATAMRASNVANFYITKYLSKAQEALGPVIQPFIAGMRRIAATEIDAAPKETLQIDAASEELDAAAEELEDAAYERLVNEDLVNALVRCKL